MNGAITSKENLKVMTMDTEKSGQMYIWYNYNRDFGGLFEVEFKEGEKGEE